MTRVSRAGGESARTFVKRQHRARRDGDLIKIMAGQARLMRAIDQGRKARGITVERFAAAAGISERSYRRAVAGLSVLRAATLAKLRSAQRRAAAGYLA